MNKIMELSSKMKERQVVVEMRLSGAIFKEIQQKQKICSQMVEKVACIWISSRL